MHSLKALPPISFVEGGISNISINWQPLKAQEPIKTTDGGMTTFESEIQFSKAFAEIEVNFSTDSNEISLRQSHLAKADLPIFSTFAGILIEQSDVHSLKTPSLISVRGEFSPNITLDNFEHPLNA